MAAATTPFVSVEEYLRTSYEPDADYIDGEIQKRNLGEWAHAKLHKLIVLALAAFEAGGKYIVAFELRVQTSATRFRIPDISASSVPKTNLSGLSPHRPSSA